MLKLYCFQSLSGNVNALDLCTTSASVLIFLTRIFLTGSFNEFHSTLPPFLNSFEDILFFDIIDKC